MKILVTGETNTVRKFVELTFANLGIELEWKGTPEEEKGIISAIKKEKLKKKNCLKRINQPTCPPSFWRINQSVFIQSPNRSIQFIESCLLTIERK